MNVKEVPWCNTAEAELFSADRRCCVFQVSAHEPCAAAGPGAAAGLPAERGAVRGSGPSPGADGVGRPWRGVLQVKIALFLKLVKARFTISMLS